MPIPYESGTRHENGETPLVSNETFEVHADIPDENVGKASAEDHDGEEAAEDDRGVVDKLLTWPVFSAIILLSGTLRMKRKDYEGMREMSSFSGTFRIKHLATRAWGKSFYRSF